MWNKFTATLTGVQKTNNLADEIQRGIKLSVSANSSDWAIIDRFRTEEAMAKQSFYQAAQEYLRPDVNKSRKLNRRTERSS
jgi:hypothetical protein